VGNEENEYQVSHPNRMLINMTNELNDIYKKSLKEEIMDELIEILMEKYKRQLNRMYRMNSSNIKTPQIKNLRRHRNN
jgi:hypothetical protein